MNSKLQGYRRNDRDVRITMNVTIGHNEEFTDFYWIIQRKYIVYEGEEECPDEGRNCYTAKRRRKIRGGRKNEFQMHLIIDKLSRDDLREPVVLVKDYEHEKTNKNLFEVQFVPKFAPIKDYEGDDEEDYFEYFDEDEEYYDEDDNDDDSTEITFEARDRTSFARKEEDPSNDNSCIIKRNKVKPGKSVSYPHLCVKLLCLKSRNVDVRSMNEKDCRRRKTKGQGADRNEFEK